MKFFVGSELTGLDHDRLHYIYKHFSPDSYYFHSTGVIPYERFVIFYEEKDATLYRLRWRK